MNKLFGTFALAGLVGLAACETRDDAVIIEDPVIEQPAPAPVVTEPAPPPPPLADDTLLMQPGTDPTLTDPAVTPGAQPTTP
jgi:hypothetical protein